MGNIVASYKFAKPLEGGGSTGHIQDHVLNSDGDFIIATYDDNAILNSDGDFILQSPFTDNGIILNSAGDKILNSASDHILNTGASADKILNIGNRIASR